MTTEEFVGKELECAYAKVFGGKVIGGFDDKGCDVTTGDSTVPVVQVKSSIRGACNFLTESLRRREFIPICIGEPGRRTEVLDSLRRFGVWIGDGTPSRQRLLTEICKIRAQCRP